MANAGIKASQAGTSLRAIMTNLSGEVKICGESIGEITIATTNADGDLKRVIRDSADCRVAFAGLSESQQAGGAGVFSWKVCDVWIFGNYECGGG